MLKFELYQKVKILYGVGAVEQLGELAASLEKQSDSNSTATPSPAHPPHKAE